MYVLPEPTSWWLVCRLQDVSRATLTRSWLFGVFFLVLFSFSDVGLFGSCWHRTRKRSSHVYCSVNKEQLTVIVVVSHSCGFCLLSWSIFLALWLLVAGCDVVTINKKGKVDEVDRDDKKEWVVVCGITIKLTSRRWPPLSFSMFDRKMTLNLVKTIH